MPQIKVGLIGFGTVGAGMVEVLSTNRRLIEDRVGAGILLKRIADLDIDSDRGVEIDPEVLTTDAMEVVDDPEIDIIVELMGGCDQAMEYILAAMERGKQVVTANKALIAQHGRILFETAERFGMDDAVSVALESRPQRMGSFRPPSSPGPSAQKSALR